MAKARKGGGMNRGRGTYRRPLSNVAGVLLRQEQARAAREALVARCLRKPK